MEGEVFAGAEMESLPLKNPRKPFILRSKYAAIGGQRARLWRGWGWGWMGWRPGDGGGWAGNLGVRVGKIGS